jgi:hypothetical protein
VPVERLRGVRRWAVRSVDGVWVLARSGERVGELGRRIGRGAVGRFGVPATGGEGRWLGRVVRGRIWVIAVVVATMLGLIGLYGRSGVRYFRDEHVRE